MPVFLGLLFFVFDEIFVLFLFFLFVLLSGFEFERIGTDHSQVRAALIATDRVAFVYVFFIHIDCAIANRTRHHRRFAPPKLLLYDSLDLLQLVFLGSFRPEFRTALRDTLNPCQPTTKRAAAGPAMTS